MIRRILISSVLLLVLLGSNGVDSEDTTPVTGDLITTGPPWVESTNSIERTTGFENNTQLPIDVSSQGGNNLEAISVNTTSEDYSAGDKTTAIAPTEIGKKSDPVGGSSQATSTPVDVSSTVNNAVGTKAVQSTTEVPVSSARPDDETAGSPAAATSVDIRPSSTGLKEAETTVVSLTPEMTSQTEDSKEETSVTAVTVQSTAAAGVPGTTAAADKASTAAPAHSVETTHSKPAGVEQTTSEQETTKAAKQSTTEAQKESTTQDPATSTDPCSEVYEIIPRTKERYYKNTDVSGPHDDVLKPKWYKFTIDGENAEIPRQCIKPGHCGAVMPYTLDPNFIPPQIGQYKTAQLQGSYKQHGRTKCNADQASVVVLNCGDFFVYNLTTVFGQSNICLKKKSDTVEYEYLGYPPPTEAPTTEAPLDLPLKDAESVQSQYTVTIVTSNNNGLTNEYLRKLDRKLRKAVADELNKKIPPPVVTTETQTITAPAAPATNVTSLQTPTATDAAAAEGTTTQATTTARTTVEQETTAVQAPVANRQGAPVAAQEDSQKVAEQIDGDVDGGVGPPMRLRRYADTVYREDHVFYVRPTPQEKDNQKEITIYVEHDKHGPVDGKTLLEALKRLNETGALGNMTGESVIDIHQGYPEDIAVIKPAKSIWHTHMGLFITVIILAVICIILLIIGLICLRCQRTGGYSTNNPEKTAITLEEGRNGHGSVESPLSDEEIVRGEASTLQAATPSYTANGRGQHLSKEEDNGWVVPINELSDQERSLVDTEDTKL